MRRLAFFGFDRQSAPTDTPARAANVPAFMDRLQMPIATSALAIVLSHLRAAVMLMLGIRGSVPSLPSCNVL
jgi:hypothetical protein